MLDLAGDAGLAHEHPERADVTLEVLVQALHHDEPFEGLVVHEVHAGHAASTNHPVVAEAIDEGARELLDEEVRVGDLRCVRGARLDQSLFGLVRGLLTGAGGSPARRYEVTDHAAMRRPHRVCSDNVMVRREPVQLASSASRKKRSILGHTCLAALELTIAPT
jgi:hypothetical protein